MTTPERRAMPPSPPLASRAAPGSARSVSALLAATALSLGLSSTLAPGTARAGGPQCEQCCADAGIYTCPTRIRVFAEGSELQAEGGGWRVTGLWQLDCDVGASFDAGATTVLPAEPRNGEVILTGSSTAHASCFADWCQLPANACLQPRDSGGSVLLRRCTDGQPLRASDLVKKGAPPPSVYVPPRPQPNPGTAPVSSVRPAVGPASTAASPAARTNAQPEAIFVTRTLVVSGGKTEVHETTTSSATGTTTRKVTPAEPIPAPTTEAPSLRILPPEPVVEPAPTPQPSRRIPDTNAPVVAPQPTPQPVVAPTPQPTPQPVVAPTPQPTPQPSRQLVPVIAPQPANPPAATAPAATLPVTTPPATTEVLVEPEVIEYPPHLPAAGPLDITLAFDLPAAPEERCYTAAPVATEARRRLDLGDEARISGDNQTAVDEYRAAVTLDRCNAIAWAALGQLALQADDLDKAVPALKIAIKLRPDHYGAANSLGLAFEALGRPDLAQDAYRRVLELRPGHQAAIDGLQRTSSPY